MMMATCLGSADAESPTSAKYDFALVAPIDIPK
jgi:hypothetical protein